MKLFIADLEFKGLLPDISSTEDMYVLSYAMFNPDIDDWIYGNTTDPIDVERFFINPDHTIWGHSFWLYDVPAVEKCLDIEVKAQIFDTLFLSWYIEPFRIKHGLEEWGEFFGIKKPEIDDWQNLSIEEYINRCDEDVKINVKLYEHLLNKLDLIYSPDYELIPKIVNFVNTKGRVYYNQQKNPFRLDCERVLKGIDKLEKEKKEREEELIKIMPKIPVYGMTKKPSKIELKSGGLTKGAIKWFNLLKQEGLPAHHEEEVKYVKDYKEANPSSTQQQKDWLFSLGWKPETFKKSFNVRGEEKLVPQIKKYDELCPSILKLQDKVPEVEHFSKLSIINHRLGFLKGLIDNSDDNKIVADLRGLTNTLRIKHRKPLANIPKPYLPYAEDIRASLLPPEDMLLVGSDLSSLESMTRNNFVYGLDPEFVELQNVEGYDPHIEIAVISKMMTEEEAEEFKQLKKLGDDSERFEELNKIRHAAKTTNYSAMYGVGPKTLSENLGITQREAKKLINAYKKKNWSIYHFADRQKVKHVGEEMWVQNPLNKYWYSLRFEKDIFSVINQSAGDYIHTMWEYFLLEEGITLHGNFHDEIITSCYPGEEEKIEEILKNCIKKVNNLLNLTIPIRIDVQIGANYSEVH